MSFGFVCNGFLISRCLEIFMLIRFMKHFFLFMVSVFVLHILSFYIGLLSCPFFNHFKNVLYFLHYFLFTITLSWLSFSITRYFLKYLLQCNFLHSCLKDYTVSLVILHIDISIAAAMEHHWSWENYPRNVRMPISIDHSVPQFSYLSISVSCVLHFL